MPRSLRDAAHVLGFVPEIFVISCGCLTETGVGSTSESQRCHDDETNSFEKATGFHRYMCICQFFTAVTG